MRMLLESLRFEHLIKRALLVQVLDKHANELAVIVTGMKRWLLYDYERRLACVF